MATPTLPPELLVSPVSGGPTLRRLNGIGTSVAGYYHEPYLKGWYYKQVIVTVLFIPVMIGWIYLVKDGDKSGRSWYFAGRITGGDFLKRFGWRGYLALKATALLEAGAVFLVMLLALFLVFAVRTLFRR